jgi:hypothetical protein
MIHYLNKLRLGKKNVQQGQYVRCVVLTTTNSFSALYCLFQFKATVGQIGRTVQQT